MPAPQTATPANPISSWAATPVCDLLSPQPVPGCHREASAVDCCMPWTEVQGSPDDQVRNNQKNTHSLWPRSHYRHHYLVFRFSLEETWLTADGGSGRAVSGPTCPPGPELGHPVLHSPLSPLPNMAILGPSHRWADLSIPQVTRASRQNLFLNPRPLTAAFIQGALGKKVCRTAMSIRTNCMAAGVSVSHSEAES